MTDYQIRNLPDTETSPATGDYLAIDDVSGSVVKKITYANLISGISGLSIPGLNIRPQFEWKDADEIYIGAGSYHHDGTEEQRVYWNSQLTKTLTGTGISWRYLYLDDSAIVTLGTNLLTATQLIWSTTAPSWSASKHGWYHPTTTDDKCIFAVYNNSASVVSIEQFFHDGGNVVLFANAIEDRAEADLDTTWTDVTLTIPDFCTRAEIIYRLDNNGTATATQAFWRTNGLSGTTYGTGDAGHLVAATVPYETGQQTNNYTVTTDSSQVIEIVHDLAGVQTSEIHTSGWYIPVGM